MDYLIDRSSCIMTDFAAWHEINASSDSSMVSRSCLEFCAASFCHIFCSPRITPRITERAGIGVNILHAPIKTCT